MSDLTLSEAVELAKDLDTKFVRPLARLKDLVLFAAEELPKAESAVRAATDMKAAVETDTENATKRGMAVMEASRQLEQDHAEYLKTINAERRRLDGELAQAKQAHVAAMQRLADDAKAHANETRATAAAERATLEAELKKLRAEKQDILDFKAKFVQG